jgi:hypothetical protein
MRLLEPENPSCTNAEKFDTVIATREVTSAPKMVGYGIDSGEHTIKEGPFRLIREAMP